MATVTMIMIMAAMMSDDGDDYDADMVDAADVAG